MSSARRVALIAPEVSAGARSHDARSIGDSVTTTILSERPALPDGLSGIAVIAPVTGSTLMMVSVTAQIFETYAHSPDGSNTVKHGPQGTYELFWVGVRAPVVASTLNSSSSVPTPDIEPAVAAYVSVPFVLKPR